MVQCTKRTHKVSCALHWIAWHDNAVRGRTYLEAALLRLRVARAHDVGVHEALGPVQRVVELLLVILVGSGGGCGNDERMNV